MTNHLALETSPYLLQHAENPVDWYPWGTEALERAAAENRPILLSIGYAACHWCHVMAHESFENPEIARLMNAHFICVKVDREERPDLDSIYMQAVQAMTGQGGWPMTVFLTPAGKPFYGGTYFPPEDRHGMPGFPRLLKSVSEAWETKPADIARAAQATMEIYAAGSRTPGAGPTATEAREPQPEDRKTGATAATLDRAAADLSARFEPMAGGFGGAPKFPQAMALDFLLRRWARTGDTRALHIVTHSFRRMARGGIYDQAGGGFHRYAVDARWLVPHFEKMLYDNALLAKLGVQLFQVTGDDETRTVTGETLDWVLREMTDEHGGWYSSLDADSEGEEGKFYVWSLAEINQVLGEDARAAIDYWGVTDGGNFEGANILHVRGDRDTAASTVVANPAVVRRWKGALYARRALRAWPSRDEKILASWNGLMLRAMAEAARVFGDARYADAAVRNADFLHREMVRDGRVLRTHMRGESRIGGFLEDHAAVGLGFLALYQLTFEKKWLDRARELADACTAYFREPTTGDFYDTASDAETLVTRPRDITDNATPAGASLAAELLLTIAEITGEPSPRANAAHLVDAVAEPMARYATMFGHILGVADMAVHGTTEIAVAGEPSAGDFQQLAAAVASRYVPSLVMAGGTGDAVRGLALMRGRAPIGGRAAAYVCRNYSCETPRTAAPELQSALSAMLPSAPAASSPIP